MNIEQIYIDYTVDYKTEGHKHCRPGWVNTPCPWCSSPEGHEGYHMGYNLHGNFFTCWRCGFKPTFPTLLKLTHLNEYELAKVIKEYGGFVARVKPIIKPVGEQPFLMPSNCYPMTKNHKRYLQGRNFDPNVIEEKWKVLGSGPSSILKHNKKIINYSHRIIIPYFWDDDQVSYSARDITEVHSVKYIACPIEREKVSHKNILYGDQKAWGDTGICVEGPTDVWRFGDQSFATSGIKFTPKQVRLMASLFKRIFVCFDGGEPQALAQANALVAELRFRGKEAHRVDIVGDPGNMDPIVAKKFVNKLLTS